MKRNFLIIVFFLISSNTFSQGALFGTYSSSYENKTQNIYITFDKKDKFTLYISATSLDKLVTNGGFKVWGKYLPDFIEKFKTAQQKYNEWIITAKENNVTSFSKLIEVENEKAIRTAKSTAYFYFGDFWHESIMGEPYFQFIVHKDENDNIGYHLLVSTSNLYAKDNRFITCSGFSMIFSSNEEISNFINAISLEKIEEFKNRPNPDELFK